MIRVAVCDDVQEVVAQVNSYLNEYYVNQLTAVVELYQTSREAQHSIKNHLLTILPYL